MDPKLARKLHALMAAPDWHFYEDYLNERTGNAFARFINSKDAHEMFSLQGEAKAYYAMINLNESIRQSLENE